MKPSPLTSKLGSHVHKAANHRAQSLDEISAAQLPRELSGQAGSNRARDIVPQIPVDTDSQAISVWLSEFPIGSATRRCYEKEVQRLYAWALAFAEKPVSSLTREDMDTYQVFMSAPPEHWCGARRTRRGTEAWRPFEGPVSPQSQAHALKVIGALFTYLLDVGYLASNPLATIRSKRKRVPAQARFSKSLPRRTFERLATALESECMRLNGSQQAHAEIERMLMVVRVLANTGLGGGELAKALIGDLHPVHNLATGADSWFLAVRRADGRNERVVFNSAAIDALHRYLRVNRVDPSNADPRIPLVLKLNSYAVAIAPPPPNSDQTIYSIVCKAFKTGADVLEANYPQDAHILRCAAPHWLRYTRLYPP